MLLVNAVSFVLARIFWRVTGKLSAKLDMPWERKTRDIKDIVVLSPGNLAQPRGAFGFLFPLLREKRCIFLKFKMIGWSAKSTVKTVLKATQDADSIMVFTISLGDQIARRLEKTSVWKKLDVCAINPCPSRKALKPIWRWLLTFLGPVFWVFCHAIGWLSIIPLIPGTGGKYSLVLLADQYMTLAYSRPPRCTTRTKRVLLSRNDELLRNAYLERFFRRANIEWVPCGHADTVRQKPVFLHGVAKLLGLRSF